MANARATIEVRALNRTQAAFTSVERNLSKLNKAANILGTTLGAGLVGNALRRTISDAARFGNTIRVASENVGIGVEALQRYRFAAQQIGISTQQTDNALQRFTRRIGEADEGTGELVGTLRKLNISTRDSSGNLKSSETLLREFGSALSGIETPAERLTASFRAFDTEQAKFGLALAQIASGTGDVSEAFRTVTVATEKETEQLADLRAAIDLAAQEWDVYLIKATAAASPTLLEFLKNTQRELEGVGEFLRGNVQSFTQWVEAIRNSFQADLTTDQLSGEIEDLTFLVDDQTEKVEALGIAWSQFGERFRGALGGEISQFQSILQGPGAFSAPEFDTGIATDFNKIIEEQARRQEAAAIAARNAKEAQEEQAQALSDLKDAFQTANLGIQEFNTSQGITFSEEGIDNFRKQYLGLGKDIELSAQIGRVAWQTFTDSTSTAIARFVQTGSLKFKDLVDSILAQMARLAANAIFSGLLGLTPLGGSVGFLAGVSRAFGFASGGVMSARGPVPLKKYQSGGIATGRQVALFGEGSGPEAFVPLPDGRAIPVQMNERGNGPTVVEVFLDGTKLFKAMGRASRDGRLVLSARAVV